MPYISSSSSIHGVRICCCKGRVYLQRACSVPSNFSHCIEGLIAFFHLSQSHGRAAPSPFSPSPLDHVSGDGCVLPNNRYPQPSLLRKSHQMLPPTPVSVPSAPCNPLEEPSPLGLTLKKTPSLLDLISLQLQHSACVPSAESENSAQGFAKSRIGKCLAPTGSAAQDKLKASNFPASTLKIGSWEVGLHMKLGESHCYVVLFLFSIQHYI